MSTTFTVAAPQAVGFPSFVRRNGVAVVYATALLDHIFPDGRTGGDPDVWGRAVVSWITAHRAHYHAWEGESYLRLAEEDRAVDAALAAHARIVVIDPLS